MRMVYIHSQVLALVEYATEGILGALAAKAASSAAAAAAEIASSAACKKFFLKTVSNSQRSEVKQTHSSFSWYYQFKTLIKVAKSIFV